MKALREPYRREREGGLMEGDRTLCMVVMLSILLLGVLAQEVVSFYSQDAMPPGADPATCATGHAPGSADAPRFGPPGAATHAVLLSASPRIFYYPHFLFLFLVILSIANVHFLITYLFSE